MSAQVTGQGKSRIFPLSETRFFLKNPSVKITFEKDAAGRVIAVIMEKTVVRKKFRGGDFEAELLKTIDKPSRKS